MTSMSSVATEGRVSGSRLVTQNMLLGLDSGWMMGRGAARERVKTQQNPPHPHSDSVSQSKRIWTKSSLSEDFFLVLTALIVWCHEGNRLEYTS